MGAIRQYIASWRTALDSAREALLESDVATQCGGTLGRSLRASVILHGLIVALAIAALSYMRHERAPASPSMVPVDIFAIADATNVIPMVRERSNPTSAVSQTAPPAQFHPAAAGNFEMKIFPQPPQQAIAALQTPVPNRGVATDPSSAPAVTGRPADAALGQTDTSAVGAKDAMTASAADLLLAEIARCWERPATSPSNVASALFELSLNSDGSISQPPQLGHPVTSQDAAFAESVRRAIYACAPYHLPLARFADWHAVQLDFGFDKLLKWRAMAPGLSR